MHKWRLGGSCKWCDADILWGAGHATKAGQRNIRRYWCSACVPLYRIATHSDDQRRAIQRRGDLVCACCAAPCRAETLNQKGKPVWHRLREWEADHRRPLWSLPVLMTYTERARWYGPDNLQMLCVPCHARKSAQEAGWRKLGVYGIALMLETLDAPPPPGAAPGSRY